jgi:phage tail sheath protein FI
MAVIDARYRLVVDGPSAGYDGLLDVQRALIRFCAARGDTVAALSLPRQFREDEAIDHVRRLASSRREDGSTDVPPLGTGEEGAFSYAAVYHPWLVTADAGGQGFLRTPPDGAACGVMAARSLARGAWIAPANEPLVGVVALEPALLVDRLGELQAAGLNVLRQEPRGFLALAAQTLSADPDLQPIGVRRLLALVRRRALRVGSQYVFEPNDEAFARMVERSFDQMLGQLQVRGAFAGATRATSYQVVADASLNTQASRDQGRFFVDLRVAPSVPLTFLTVRLVQEGDRLTVSEGR